MILQIDLLDNYPDSKNATSAEWHEALIYACLTQHYYYGRLFKSEIIKFSENPIIKDRKHKWLHAYKALFEKETKFLELKINSYHQDTIQYIDDRLTPLMEFTTQFVYFNHKMQTSLCYFLDYPLTQSYNALIVRKEERENFDFGVIEP
jgi:hypothetical protein